MNIGITEYIKKVNAGLKKAGHKRIKERDEQEARVIFDCWRLGYWVRTAVADIKRIRAGGQS